MKDFYNEMIFYFVSHFGYGYTNNNQGIPWIVSNFYMITH